MSLLPHDGGAGTAVVSALRQALPYLRLFAGKTFVIKTAGALFDDAPALRDFLEQVSVLHRVGVRVVLVHGGGPQTTRTATRLGIETRFAGGRRVTSPETLGVAAMVMNSDLNPRAVALFRELGIPAVGVSGVDGRLVVAERRPPVEVDGERVDYGCVGDVAATDPTLVRTLGDEGFLPVVSPISADESGALLNINADTVAARLAVDLGAEKLIVASSVAGILEAPGDPHSLLTYLDVRDLDELDARGVIQDGMRPKLAAARAALEGGVARVHVISALAADALLTEIFTNEGSGTLLVRRKGGPEGNHGGA